jgi:acetyl-CoA acetyltransferase
MHRKLAGNVAAGLPRQICVVGASGIVQAGSKDHVIVNDTEQTASSTTLLIHNVLSKALEEARLKIIDIDGLIAVPSLKDNHFMEAHYQATSLGMFQSRPNLRCKTIDTGGAGPVSALIEATRMIKYEGLECVALIAADMVGGMSSDDFLSRANGIFHKLDKQVPSPAIPHGYDKLTSYQMHHYHVTRDQLRMAVCLESLHAGIHENSLFRKKELERQEQKESSQKDDGILYTSLKQVQEAPSVTPNISILECARRADGAAAVILTSNRFLARRGLYAEGLPTIIGGGESSGPLYPLGTVSEEHFSCEKAMSYAYASAGNLTAKDIDFFGLYDCFPICLVRALESSGLCEKGKAGDYLEQQYKRMMSAIDSKRLEELLRDDTFFPVNTHGGLLCFGAPWEVPAMYNILEAVQQLKGEARGRQIKDCRRALVYGNGGVMSASAVAILSRSL